ncbi:hypothetical protein CCHR01_15221 [Colletotrichum chrysophilum]|uniref:Uncharacterized protein n=1 Tax=Colletotrichum chrysophilum TaxID=1836956 RepID=A0AAD9A6R4_9PEZI|nr:hypothetical protein CCHR01_15221 [Colletotrichum chrysophilum]
MSPREPRAKMKTRERPYLQYPQSLESTYQPQSQDKQTQIQTSPTTRYPRHTNRLASPQKFNPRPPSRIPSAPTNPPPTLSSPASPAGHMQNHLNQYRETPKSKLVHGKTLPSIPQRGNPDLASLSRIQDTPHYGDSVGRSD